MHAAVLLLALSADADGPIAVVPDFTLIERGGATVTRGDLLGKVWVASFILIRCPNNACPEVTRTVQRLQGELAGRAGLRFVTFTVDPERDDPKELARYADSFAADPKRWMFLTGSAGQIEGLLEKFLQPGKRDPKTGVRPHLPYLFVVNRDGQVVSYHQGLWDKGRDTEKEFEDNLRRLKRSIDAQLKPDLPGWLPSDFPAFNASLNALATVLLLVGYWAVRVRNYRLHVTCMVTALLVSALFLASYLFFHLYVKGGRPTYFSEQAPDAPPWVGMVYAAVLLSHTVLAVVATPLALYTAWVGWRGNWTRHVWVARWAFPIWLYVSTTGVVVYWMLYRLYPSP
jgi:protein SCO1/2/putative membrane protein